MNNTRSISYPPVVHQLNHVEIGINAESDDDDDEDECDVFQHLGHHVCHLGQEAANQNADLEKTGNMIDVLVVRL